jgi:hypothetical protein
VNLKIIIIIMTERGKTVKDLVAELEAELQMKLDIAQWTTEQIQDMYDTFIGSMYNGINWRL